MKIRRTLCAAALLLALAQAVRARAQPARPAKNQAAEAAQPVILTRDQAATLMPPTVFFRGQNATIQGRNSAGLRLPGGKLMLAAIVDTAGYSSALEQAYQAYLLTEIPLSLAGHGLPPGAYGFGFVGDSMLVMNLGGDELLRAAVTRDASLSRPNPLQILAGSAPGSFRLYLGRSYVTLAPVE